MNTLAYASFAEHAESVYPQEGCGLLVLDPETGQERYVVCENISSVPERAFVIDPVSYLRAKRIGKITAVCHSHPNGPVLPSLADRTACETSKLTWYVLATPGGELHRMEPSGFRAPLLERPFVHGVHDCYALVRDYYQEELGIELPDFARDDEWWEGDANLYVDNFVRAGFRVIEEPRLHSVILMQLRATKPNHAAVFLGNMQMMHHLRGWLSSRTVYGGYWQKHTTHVLLHEAVK